jgi:acetolactate decarboxylase
MVNRRSILKVGLGLCGCAICAAGGFGTAATGQERQVDIQGRGYALHYIGAQRDTVMNGKLSALIDLRALAKTSHLYGIGPMENLRGEVTIANSRPALAQVGAEGNVQVRQSFESGAPFFVWAEVPTWRTLPIPAQVHSYGDLEKFVPEVANSVGVDPHQPLPFLLRGRLDAIEFHILSRVGDEAHDAQKHRKIQKVFESERLETVMIGFYAPGPRGVFTPMDSAIHIHFQSTDNQISGHVQKLSIVDGVELAFPST